MTLMTLFFKFKVTGSRSRSVGNGQRNVVTSMAPEPRKGCEPKLIRILYTCAENLLGFQGSKDRVTETFTGGGITSDGPPSKTI